MLKENRVIKYLTIFIIRTYFVVWFLRTVSLVKTTGELCEICFQYFVIKNGEYKFETNYFNNLYNNIYKLNKNIATMLLKINTNLI